MPQNAVIRYESLTDALEFQKDYQAVGASTHIVEDSSGAYLLVVIYPSGVQTPQMAEVGPGAGEEIEGKVEPEPMPREMGATDPKPSAVPFAAQIGPIADLYWPLVTGVKNARVVSYRTTQGKIVGRDSRMFLADRSNGTRYHVGVDLFCQEGDEVISISDGLLVAFHPFYRRPRTGEETYALLIRHDAMVVNYGEVKADSLRRYGLAIGSTVKAGQRIGRVSGTSMIHFETYEATATRTSRWMKTDTTPPSNLRDPTAFLLKLASGAKFLYPAGLPVQNSHVYSGPQLGSSNWHNMHGGRQWRYDERGVYTIEHGELKLWRSGGEPVTCRDIFFRFGELILDAATKHGVNPAIIIMTIATETQFARDAGFTGPQTFRWEAKVDNTDVSPNFKGSYSAGPMQCLATTVREVIRDHGSEFGIASYSPLVVAPAIQRKPDPAPSTHPLYEPAISIDIGTAEIRMRWSKSGDDPILVAACYNAGGLYPSDNSSWGLRAQGNHLDRAAEWFGDACAVLVEEGVL